MIQKHQYDVHDVQAVEELPTAQSHIGFEQPGDPQQSVMITGSSAHKLTSENLIMDAPTTKVLILICIQVCK